MMVISRTPFRVSLAGGGSDLPDYYRHGSGAVVSMAIDRYMYVTVNRRFDASLRVSYTRTEIVERVDDLHHDLIREALKRSGLTAGIEVTTIADLPAGIGLGSSSTLTVGVLNALYAMRGTRRTPGELAREACEIEIDVLGHPIGKQDQYIAAYGGLQFFRFDPDGTVAAHPVISTARTRQRLIGSLMLFYTGVARDAGSVLGEARQRLRDTREARALVAAQAGAAKTLRDGLGRGRVTALGPMLHEGWEKKKQMASTVSNRTIDGHYDAARRAGAVGGKVSGAGGGGCLLLFVPLPRQASVRRALTRRGLRELPFHLEPEGSRIIHYGR